MFIVCALFYGHPVYSDAFCLKGVQPANKFYVFIPESAFLYAEFVFHVFILVSHERPR